MNPPLRPRIKRNLSLCCGASILVTFILLLSYSRPALLPSLALLNLALVLFSSFWGGMGSAWGHFRKWQPPALFIVGILGLFGTIMTDVSQEDFEKATRRGDAFWLAQLLDRGNHGPDVVDIFGNSLLMKAAQYGNTDTVEELLRRRAHTDYRDGDGDTALSVAEDNHHSEIVRMLRAAGAKR